jgi:hypothetical protein
MIVSNHKEVAMRVHAFLRSLSSYVIVTSIALVLADRLLSDGSPGWVVGVVLMMGVVMVVARHPQLLRDPRGAALLLALFPVVASCVYDQGWLAPTMGAGLLVVCAWWGRGARYCGVLRWGSAIARLPFAFMAQVTTDRRLVRTWRMLHERKVPGAGIWLWCLPLILGAGFVALFGVANPIIGQWFSEVGEWMAAWFDFGRWLPTPMRVLLWWVVGCGAWILLRLRPPRLAPLRQAIPTAEVDRTALVWRCLLVVNVVFAMQVALDLMYLVGGLHLPQDMTYASYAHRGAWPLLIAALVSAALVLAAFRPGGAAQQSTWARRLVLLWLGQNVALTIAAAWRLWLYVDTYGLSSWRLGAAMWMGLVAVGLVLIALRIACARSNRWLIDANAVSTLVTLVLCCWLDVGGTVAWHNVRHCREAGGAGVAIDLAYLDDFGVKAAPALAWLAAHSSDLSIARNAKAMADAQRDHALTLLEDWRAWTWIRKHVAELPKQISDKTVEAR